MKKIFAVIFLAAAMTGCGGSEKSGVAGTSAGIAGIYTSNGRAHTVFTFKNDGTMLLSAQDGSGGTFNYKVEGKNLTVKGIVPSEYHLDENGNLTNEMNRDVLVKKP